MTRSGCCSALPLPLGKGAERAQPGRPRCPGDHRVPAAPAGRPREQRPDPQRPAGGGPLAVRLRGPAPSRARALIQRVLAIPGKRRDRTDVTYLTPDEADALLAACDQSTRTGRRDHAILALAVQALRVSELTSLTCADIRIQAGPHVHCTGKGRKERDTPLLPATVRIMKAWLAERGGQPGDPLFPGPSGQRLSRDAVERRVKLYHERASAGCRPWRPSTSPPTPSGIPPP